MWSLVRGRRPLGVGAAQLPSSRALDRRAYAAVLAGEPWTAHNIGYRFKLGFASMHAQTMAPICKGSFTCIAIAEAQRHRVGEHLTGIERT